MITKPLPAHLPPLPEGYVYLGMGGTFKLPPTDTPFRGLRYDPNYPGNWVDDFWYGGEDCHYAAPADSEIVRLNYGDPVKSELLAALKASMPLLPIGVTACHGDKCRQAHCRSCNEPEDARKAAADNRAIWERAKAAISRAEGGQS